MYRQRLTQYKLALRRATPFERHQLATKFMRAKIILEGKAYLRKINKIYQKAKRSAIRNPSSENHAKVVNWRNRFKVCEQIYDQTRNYR